MHALPVRFDKRTKGFTLIEILVVITILALLIVIGAISYSSVNKKSRDARRKSDIEQFRSALEMYRADKGYYPSGAESFTPLSLINSGPAKTLYYSEYITSLPSDPKDNATYPYQLLMTDRRGVSPNWHYYGYCLIAYMEESENGVNNCGVTLPTPSGGNQYNYGLKNP